MCSFIIALDNPLNDPKSKISKEIGKIDVSLTVIFTFEAAAKIISYGLMNCGSMSYLKNPWNVLDFIVVLVSVSYYIFIFIVILINSKRIKFKQFEYH